MNGIDPNGFDRLHNPDGTTRFAPSENPRKNEKNAVFSKGKKRVSSETVKYDEKNDPQEEPVGRSFSAEAGRRRFAPIPHQISEADPLPAPQ